MSRLVRLQLAMQNIIKIIEISVSNILYPDQAPTGSILDVIQLTMGYFFKKKTKKKKQVVRTD